MLRFFDSVSHYSTAHIIRKWNSSYNGVVLSGAGRFGGGALSGSSDGYIQKVLDPQGTWIVGLAVKRASGWTEAPLVSFLDASTTQCDLYMDNDGALVVRRGIDVIATSTWTMPESTYYFVEIKVTIGNSANVSVRVDNIERLAVSGADTQNTLNAYADRIRLHVKPEVTYSDIYICDSTGTSCNDFLGETRAVFQPAQADGSYNEWTPSTGTTRYTMVSESSPNDDTNYVFSAAVGEKTTFNFPALPVAQGNIVGVQILSYARKDNAGTGKFKHLLRRNSTDVVLGEKLIASTYQYHSDMLELDPLTGSPWTIPNLQSTEIGVETA